ncbi:MAG TPA: histidine--tRNA ligase [Candidatus Paceibacterota bacterium]|nr:histidine--tRNA ligase [Candidatus Paceibacterota bacterium]
MTNKASTPKKTSQDITSPKGMRDIIGDEYYKFQGFFEKAQEVAVYYGFRPIETPLLEQEATFTSAVGIGTDIVDKEMYTLKTRGGDHLALRPEQTAGLMRAYIEHGMHNQPQPVLFYHSGPVFRHEKQQRGRYRQFYQFDVDILGSEKSILDALVIKTLYTILQEAGAPNLSITINSIGDKDSRPVYIRELVSYYKKHLTTLPAIDRERLKTNPLRILDSKEEATKALNADAPDAISFLSANGKRHFKEVLESLDQMNIPYQISKSLVRGLSYYTHTVFEIVEDTLEGPVQLAGGGRYDYLGKILGSKKEIPAVGGSFGIDRIVGSAWYKDLAPRIMKKPKVYFIQVGMEAKLKSLSVIEVLRKAHIPIMQSLSKDSLSAQLAVAEKSDVPYVIIFGQMEAVQNTVIVRNMESRSQDTVSLAELPNYIKHLK